METADEDRCDLRYKAIVTLELALVLTAVVRVNIADVHNPKHGDDHIVTASAVSTTQTGGDTAMPLPVAQGGSSGAGAMEEGKGFYAGRPLFKVPPSSPCRSKAMRF